MSDKVEVPFDFSDVAELASPGQVPKVNNVKYVKEEAPPQASEAEGEEETTETDRYGYSVEEGEDEVEEGEEGEEAEETEEAEEEDPHVALLKEMKEEILSLRQQLGEMKKEEAPPQEPQAIDFVDQDTFDEMSTSLEGMNKVLNTVYQAGRQAIMLELPDMIEKATAKSVRDFSLIEAFYKSNPDLVGLEAVVSEVAQEVTTEMGKGADAKKVMTEIAKRARAKVGKAAGNKDGRGKAVRTTGNPGAIRARGTRQGSGKPVSKKPSLSNEIMSLKNL